MISVRLQKYLATCGVASRRKAEEIIQNGRVKVNGEIIKTLGTKVNENDIICVDDKEVKPKTKKYIVLNKPPFYICSKKDQWNRKTIFDLIKNNDKDESLFYVGRLDYQSCGLIILTNDGDFGNSIIHPSFNILKGYLVKSVKAPDEDVINKFLAGVTIENVSYKAKKIERMRDNQTLKIFLNEGKKREIRVVYKWFGYDIIELKRVSIGGLKLSDLGLKFGEYRCFDKAELSEVIYG